MTDVTGFGLLGHALEMARGAGATVRLRLGESADCWPRRKASSQAGYSTGASHAQLGELRARRSSCRRVFKTGAARLLTDPQTSGGLLVACDAEAAAALSARIRQGAIRRPASSGASSAARRWCRVE